MNKIRGEAELTAAGISHRLLLTLVALTFAATAWSAAGGGCQASL